jgi:thiamine pyrophosphate-dependent acetolactate synthase large subunit-like protein
MERADIIPPSNPSPEKDKRQIKEMASRLKEHKKSIFIVSAIPAKIKS